LRHRSARRRLTGTHVRPADADAFRAGPHRFMSELWFSQQQDYAAKSKELRRLPCHTPHGRAPTGGKGVRLYRFDESRHRGFRKIAVVAFNFLRSKASRPVGHR
jgi:hypothetical protein